MNKLYFLALLTSPLLTTISTVQASDFSNRYANGSTGLIEISPSQQSTVEVAKLLPDSSVDVDIRFFGYSVSIDGNRALIGAHNDEIGGVGTGAAYVFELVEGAWIQTAQLSADDGLANEQFGKSVSLLGDRALIGAVFDDDNGFRSGSAYIFDLTANGWVQSAKLLADDGDNNDKFGFSVSLAEDKALIGSPDNAQNGSNSGAAYVFDLTSNGWAQTTKLMASDAQSDDTFGSDVSLSANRALIGSPLDSHDVSWAGSAYVFDLIGAQWVESSKLTANGDADPRDMFGFDVSLSGDRVLIGASGDDSNAGAAYVFELDKNSWQQKARLIVSDGEPGDGFGRVSILGNKAVIAAPFDSGKQFATGSAYVFVQDKNGWQQTEKLTASDAQSDDLFGFSVGLSSDHILVGAYGNDDQGIFSGSSYVFDVGNDGFFRGESK